MKERPILFSAPMVRAILAGTKTQTRRLVKPQPPHSCSYVINGAQSHALCFETERGCQPESFPNWVKPTAKSIDHRLPCPQGRPRDRLWVKETYIRGGNGKPYYCADGDREVIGLAWENGFRKTPSIFMRRWESRIALEITDVRVERLNAISEADAIAEGIEQVEFARGKFWKNYQFKTAHPRQGIEVTDDKHRVVGFGDPLESYRSLWEAINGAGSWAANPWVWVIEFKRV